VIPGSGPIPELSGPNPERDGDTHPRGVSSPDATTQVSYSGTPRGPDGTAWPDDYNRDLANPVRRMEIFEEMGNDDAVQTGILARRQEICAANWQLSTEDTTPLGQEILEFTEDNVYPVLDSILRLRNAIRVRRARDGVAVERSTDR
jgi:hypothetical protein